MIPRVSPSRLGGEGSASRFLLVAVGALTKNVVLIGANSGSAKEMMPRMLEQNDVCLTLFLRRASRLRHLRSDRVQLIDGDATNVADLADALIGRHIVISAMGGMDLVIKTANVVRAMKAAGVRRSLRPRRRDLRRAARALQRLDKCMVG